MKTAITLLLPLLLSAAVNVQAGTFVSHSRAIPDRYIVLFDSSVTRNDVDARVADIEARWKVVVDRRGGTRAVFKNAVRGFAGKLSIEAARAIAGEPGILLVEQDIPLRISSGSRTLTSDQQWNLDRLDQTTPVMANGLYVGDRLYGYGTSGSSSTYVYVVDSGVLRTHQEFDYWQVNPGRQFSTDGFSETSPCGGEVSLGDYRFGSHGTAVASVIAGKVVGVAPGVSLVPVKIGNCDGTSYLSWWCWAMDWVASPAYYDPATGQPDLERGNPYPKSGAVLNLSVYYDLDAPFDAQTPLGAFEHTVQNVIAAGITVVASANNGYKDSCQTSPARLAHGNYDATSGDAWRSAPHRVISVGGTDEYDRRWRCGDFGDCFASNYGSNNGRCVDLYAPAHNVKVAYFGREIYDGVNYFYPYRPAGGPSSGTSFAAPLVAGVAARLLQSSFMSPSSLWQAILARTLPLPRNFDDDGVDANDRLVFISPGE